MQSIAQGIKARGKEFCCGMVIISGKWGERKGKDQVWSNNKLGLKSQEFSGIKPTLNKLPQIKGRIVLILEKTLHKLNF